MSRRSTRFILFAVFASVFSVVPLHAQEADASAESENPAATAPTKPDKRLFGVLPNYRTVDASIPFQSLSARQKLSIARHDSFDWPTYVFAGALTFATPGDHQSSFVVRYVRSSADQISGNMLTEGFLPVFLHQDPRYFRPGTGSFGSRLGSALSQIVVAHNDSGHRTFNVSEFLGNTMAVGISNAYTPSLNSWSHRSEKLILMISTDTFSNVIKEFGPDIRQRVFHHKHNS